MNRRAIIAASFRGNFLRTEHCSPTRRAKCLSKYVFPHSSGPCLIWYSATRTFIPFQCAPIIHFPIRKQLPGIRARFVRVRTRTRKIPSIKFKAATDPCGILCEWASGSILTSAMSSFDLLCRRNSQRTYFGFIFSLLGMPRWNVDDGIRNTDQTLLRADGLGIKSSFLLIRNPLSQSIAPDMINVPGFPCSLAQDRPMYANYVEHEQQEIMSI